MLCQRKPRKVEGSAWPAWTLEWDLPADIDVATVLARHSQPRLLERLGENLPLQVIEHRGMFNMGQGVQECTKSSLLAALGGGGRNLTELDVCLTSDRVPIVSHDLNSWRISSMDDKLFSEIDSSHLKDVPVIIREVSNGEILEKYRRTPDCIPFLESALESVFSVNPDATVFLDGRNYEAHLIVAWLSHRSQFHLKIVLIFYTFGYLSGDAFVQAVVNANAAPGWRKMIALMPAVFPEELCRLCQLKVVADPSVDDLYLAGKDWIDSVLSQDMWVVAVHIVFSGVTKDMIGPAAGSNVVLAFDADEAAMKLAYYVKDDPDIRLTRPHLKFVSVTRCYDFASVLNDGKRGEYSINIKTGRSVRHETDDRRNIRWKKGTPGNTAAIADWVISDRSEDEMAFYEWKLRGVIREVNHICPHLDVISQE
nr:agrocinopine synthase [Ipomoea batatas]GMD64788.1 agrocinopine synthase [Ipomoea batatas]